MHALSSACTTLRVSLRLLGEIETALGIAQEHGATASIRLVSVSTDNHQPHLLSFPYISNVLTWRWT